MRIKYSRLLTFIIAFSMILSMHVTFAEDELETTSSPVINLGFKVDSNELKNSITMYFDEYGNEIDESEVEDPEYSVTFTLTKEGGEYKVLSYTTVNLEITELAIKGGTTYEYYGPNDTSGLTAPEGKGISHFTFSIEIKTPEPQTYKVLIDKSFVGETDYDFDDVVFTLTGPDNYNETESPDINGDAVFSGLAAGTYTLTENSLDGVTSSLPANGLDIEFPKDADNDDEYKVSVTNTVDDTPWEGKIIIDKSFVGETDYDFDDVVFTLTGPDNYNETESPDINGDAVFSGLAAGTYTLTENSLDGITSSLDEDGLEIELPTEADNNDEYKVSITNTVDGELGSLIVQKRIERVGGSVDSNLGDGEFTVQLTGPNSYDEEKIINGPGESGNHVTFEDLPHGTYTLTETFIDDDIVYSSSAFELVVQGNQNNIPLEDNEIEIEGNHVVLLINKVADDWEGNLRIIKTFTDQADPEGIEFTLTGPNDEVQTVETDDSGEAEFTNLTEGSYNLFEDTPDGYVSSLGEDGRNFTLPGDFNWEENDYYRIVRVTNTPEDEWEGNIRVTKSFTDESDPEDIAFTLTGPGEFEQTKETDEYGEVEFLNLPTGEYTLTEDTPEGYISSLGVGGMDITLPGDYEWEENDGYLFIDVTNRPEPEDWEGTIRIVKSVDDAEDDDPDLDGFTFRLYMVDDDDEDLVGTRTTGISGIISFTGLAEGDYVLYENNRSNFIRGIDSDGLEITLPSEDADDDVLTIEVENIRRYTRPDPRPRPRPRPEPEPAPEVEAEVIIPDPEPLPQAPPVIIEPEVEVVEEPTPLATLPRTGASDPTVFAGFGAAFMALGLYLKKKRF